VRSQAEPGTERGSLPPPARAEQADLNAAPAAHLPHFAIFPFGAHTSCEIMEVRIEKGRRFAFRLGQTNGSSAHARHQKPVVRPPAQRPRTRRQRRHHPPEVRQRPTAARHPRAPFRPARLAAHRGRRRVRRRQPRLDNGASPARRSPSPRASTWPGRPRRRPAPCSRTARRPRQHLRLPQADGGRVRRPAARRRRLAEIPAVVRLLAVAAGPGLGLAGRALFVWSWLAVGCRR